MLFPSQTHLGALFECGWPAFFAVSICIRLLGTVCTVDISLCSVFYRLNDKIWL